MKKQVVRTRSGSDPSAGSESEWRGITGPTPIHFDQVCMCMYVGINRTLHNVFEVWQNLS